MRQALFATLLLAASACDAAAPPAPDYRPEEAGTVDHALCLLGFTGLPLRRTAATGHHLIEGQLNGRPALFVVDTGANVSVVDDDHVATFGLAQEGIARGGAVLVGGVGAARQVPIDSLSLGGVPIRQRRIVVADLGQISAMLRPLAGGEVHGLIGQDVLNEHRAVIDMSRPILFLIEADRDPAPIPAEQCQAEEGEAAENQGR